jgi:hypothetical protein
VPKYLITLVDQILAAKRQHTPLSPLDRGELAREHPSNKRGQGVCSNADTSALEREIDEMVYKLYGLTEEEIAIVEGKG